MAGTAGAAAGGATGAALRDRIIAVAAQRQGVPYALPPHPPETLDCSMYVLLTFEDAGLPFPGNVRTAEQIRLASVPIDAASALPGDLLFFEDRDDPPPDPVAADGLRATHVGISLGADTHQMWNAVASAVSGIDAVQITHSDGPWWTDRFIGARRHPELAGQ